MDAAVADTELLAQIRRLAADARRVTSVCSGAFLLAAAGPAGGPTRDHPLGRLRSAGGRPTPRSPWIPTPSTSRTATCGPPPASPPASTWPSRWSPTTTDTRPPPPSRASWSSTYSAPAARAQYSALLAGQAADTEPVRDLLSWLRDHLTEDLSLPALARQINLSERQFTRVFKAQVGATAADHVEAVRLESACRLLESTNRTIEQIARTCGFGTPETMNRTFRRRLNTTPGDHRHHFRGDLPASHR